MKQQRGKRKNFYRWFIIGGALLCFACIAYWISSSETIYADTVIREWVYSLRSSLLNGVFITITYMGNWQTITVLALILLIVPKTRRKIGIPFAVISLASTGIYKLVKEIFQRPRPELAARLIEQGGYSFPSGHSQMMATVGSAIPLWYRKNSLWYFFIPLMFLVAFSRMYLGVHYPRDVFVGLLLGVGISWLCAKLWDRALGHSGLFAATFGLMSIFLFVARSHDFLQLYGLFGGFAAGCAYEERYVRFGMRDRASRKAARFVLGLCVIGVVYGLGKLLPDLLWLIPIRYFFVAFAGYGLVPMLFKKLGI